ncbi:Rab geranylgeranyltransferase [Elasticomyces elasticus]|nr:Rab geranylgeranyltransferase [Elasticomyces elasticus]
MASHNVARATTALSAQARQKEIRQIEQYRSLVDEVNRRIANKDFTGETLQLTAKLLSENPEYYTIWNHRRRILLHAFDEAEGLDKDTSKSSNEPLPSPAALDHDDDPAAAGGTPHKNEPAPPASNTEAQKESSLLIQEDLTFLLPLLKAFPKCYWIWNHRSWLLSQATQRLSISMARTLWSNELKLVSKLLSIDGRNFHGWGYRRTIIGALESPPRHLNTNPASSVGGDGASSMLESEFAYTTQMINTNLSNFSAWHSRSRLIPTLLEQRSASRGERVAFLEAELGMITNGLWTDPFDQSLWFYYAWLLNNVLPPERGSENISGNSNSSSSELKRRIVPDLSVHEATDILSREIDNLKDLLDDTRDCKYIYVALLTYTPHLISLRGRRVGEGRGGLMAEGDELTAGREARNEEVDDKEAMRAWLDELMKLDPLRRGRWMDIRKGLES